MSTISGVGGVNRPWDSGLSRQAEHEARLFAKVDSDGSGGVDATELAAMLAHTGQSGDSAELLKKMDGDGDGSLTQDELSQGMRDLMPPPTSTLAFAQQRGTAGDESRFATSDGDGGGPPSRAQFDAGRPPPAQPATSAGTTATTSAASADNDRLDTNKDGTVSEIERLAGELKVLAQGAGSSESSKPLDPEIAQLAQKLYDQIARNWLPSAASTAPQVGTTA